MHIMRLLLGPEGIDYNCVDANGHTPLMMVAESRFQDNARMTALAHAISMVTSTASKPCSRSPPSLPSIRPPRAWGLTYLMLAANPLSAPASASRRQRSECTRSHSSSTCRPILVA
ncbi:hypothetical protein FA15DRAFT_675696 [Coprinopsis marcescibilis]|uniref:Ankyrin n=1 Tax=Coprinopsis marcescibilis TaxID=230819 RepID=A0A5C3KE02_COPMA|nr:hypothetical protein FA15DRAFT_675696 [Coprinopsis marcescibilis]